VQFAKDNQITQIVLGASRRSRWEQVTSRASVVQRVLRFARQAGVDVHVIARWGQSTPLSTAAAPEDPEERLRPPALGTRGGRPEELSSS
jgi:K+-sensing histidine kinase KdpD